MGTGGSISSTSRRASLDVIAKNAGALSAENNNTIDKTFENIVKIERSTVKSTEYELQQQYLLQYMRAEMAKPVHIKECLDHGIELFLCGQDADECVSKVVLEQILVEILECFGVHPASRVLVVASAIECRILPERVDLCLFKYLALTVLRQSERSAEIFQRHNIAIANKEEKSKFNC